MINGADRACSALQCLICMLYVIKYTIQKVVANVSQEKKYWILCFPNAFQMVSMYVTFSAIEG